MGVGSAQIPADDRPLRIQFDRGIIGGNREGLGIERVVLDADAISPELIGVDQCVVHLIAHP